MSRERFVGPRAGGLTWRRYDGWRNETERLAELERVTTLHHLAADVERSRDGRSVTVTLRPGPSCTTWPRGWRSQPFSGLTLADAMVLAFDWLDEVET